MALKQAQDSLCTQFTEYIQEKGPFERKIKQQATTASRHHPSGQVWDWLTRFSVSDPSKLSTSGLNCQLLTTWPVRKHRHISSPDRKHYLGVLTPFCCPNCCSYGAQGAHPHNVKSDMGAVVSDLFFSQICATAQEVPSNRHKTSPVPHLVLTTSCWICSSYPDSQDRAISHKCHNWAQVTNMCQVSTTLCLASGYQSSWSFSSQPLLTPTATSPQENCLVWFMKKWFCYIGYVYSMYLLFKCCCWIYIRG